MSESSHIGPDVRREIAALIESALDARRIALSRELAAIPPPVPACDVDFNRLLEDRGRIADELQRMRRLLDTGPQAGEVVVSCRASALLPDATKAQIEALLSGVSPHACARTPE